MAPQHSSTANLEVSGTVAFTLGLGTFVLGASALAVVLFVLSASLVSIGRARARGWSAERVGVTAAVLVGAVLFALVGWAVARLVGVLVVGLGVWFAWHVDMRQRAREL
jgi:fatty acid desaturase